MRLLSWITILLLVLLVISISTTTTTLAITEEPIKKTTKVNKQHHHHHHDHNHNHNPTTKTTTTTNTLPKSDPPAIITSLSSIILPIMNIISQKFSIPISMVGAILGTLIISILGNIGILAFVFMENISNSALNVMVAFAVGGLLGDVFLHLLPHTSHYENGGYWVLFGILTFFLIEKIVLRRVGGNGHSHSTTEQHQQPKQQNKSTSSNSNNIIQNHHDGHSSSTPKPGAILNFIADFAHNFIDGMAIASAFQASPTLGVSTTTAVLLHEIPHEMGDFAVLVSQGISHRSAFLAQLISAVGAMLGCIFGLLVTSEQPIPALCFTAGGFIYVSLADILPQILDESSSITQTICEVIAMFIAVGIMASIAELEESSHQH
jgi:zinc transporter 7